MHEDQHPKLGWFDMGGPDPVTYHLLVYNQATAAHHHVANKTHNLLMLVHGQNLQAPSMGPPYESHIQHHSQIQMDRPWILMYRS